MSSETSTEPLAPPRAPSGPGALEPWQLFTLAGLLGATAVVLVSRGQPPAGIVLLSLTILTAAVVGIAAWRTLAPFTGWGHAVGPQVVGGRTRAALEREKALVLRSIKELEFDRAMGKVSDKDFTEMSGRLRLRAAGLLRQLDAGSAYRAQIEKEIERRIGAAPASKAPASVTPATTAAASRAYAVACASCGQDNDVDARFCKHCGTRLEGGA
jgi:hypothetical protein